jgi:SAM-dependent methyltransferase
MEKDVGDPFGNAAAYDGYVGRWSRLVARQFIAWLNLASGLDWLDMGAGTGLLTLVILEEASPAKVVGIDSSAAYIELARQRVRDDRAEFTVGDASNLSLDQSQFDVAVAGLVLNFVPSAEQAVKNMAHAVRSGGTVAAYVWDYGGRMEMMRHFWDAAITVDPSASELDAGQRFEICKPDNLRALFQAIGLTDVEVMPIDIQTHFKDFDDYWLPFLAAQGSVSKYLRGLSEEMLSAVRNQLQQQLPTADDGSIPLIARAWAVKGKR